MVGNELLVWQQIKQVFEMFTLFFVVIFLLFTKET